MANVAAVIKNIQNILRTDRGTFDVARDMKTGRWSLVGIHD